MLKKDEFKELDNKLIKTLNSEETIEISGGGACDILWHIFNFFR